MPTNKELEKAVNETANRLDEIQEAHNASVDALEDLSNRTEGLSGKMDEVLGALKGMSAQDRPTSFRDTVEAEEIIQDEQLPPAEFKDDRRHMDDEPILEEARVKDVDSPEFKAKADHEAFMHEMLTVALQDVSDPNADPVVSLGVNNIKRAYLRPGTYKMERFFVECLARARPVHYQNEEYMEADGTAGVRWPQRRGLRYPFAVMDDSPRGKAWLQRILREP